MHCNLYLLVQIKNWNSNNFINNYVLSVPMYRLTKLATFMGFSFFHHIPDDIGNLWSPISFWSVAYVGGDEQLVIDTLQKQYKIHSLQIKVSLYLRLTKYDLIKAICDVGWFISFYLCVAILI